VAEAIFNWISRLRRMRTGCSTADLARGLVQTAYRLLVPYTHACPACTDAMFQLWRMMRSPKYLRTKADGTMMVNAMIRAISAS